VNNAIATLESLNGQATLSDLPPIVDAASFVSEHLSEPPQLVRGVLHQGSMLALGGGSKSFKTWCLLDLALSVAHGADWLGFPTERGRMELCSLVGSPLFTADTRQNRKRSGQGARNESARL
jgi:hypothetical protein